MDDNEPFIEGEFLEEELVHVDDMPGTSHHLDENPEAAIKRSIALMKKDDTEEDDFEEEEIQGQIIQGEDGEYYIVMEDDGVDNVELDDDPNTVEMLVSPDGEQQLVFQTVIAHPNVHMKRTRPARAILQDTEAGQVEMIQFTDLDEEGGPQIDLAVGAIQTAEANDEHILHHGMMMEQVPQGLKMRRTRVYGTCRCAECGQSFVNTARLERHLAVHQVFGSFLCPLCGKTYKYEYNLFYHWRRTCRDLNELMNYDDRKTMDVNALRALVDEVAAKKQEYGPIEIGISRSVLFQSGPLARLEMPNNPLGRRGTSCRACGIVVHQTHLEQHLNLHKGVGGVEPDQRSRVGGYYCDLCGLMFRQHFNLIKHWRTNCAEIQANLPEGVDITLDDGQLKDMVRELLTKASTNEAILDAEAQRVKTGRRGAGGGSRDLDVVGGYDDEMPESRRERERDEAEARGGGNAYDESGEGEYQNDESVTGAVFADDFEDDEVHMLGEAAIVEGGTVANRTKWNMAGGPIQCSECFRSFANQGRLERHMAGFHASHGSHHCALCGNRFKYDYNLLYHYRKSCPYTKNFIDRDVREQMDAANLRKLVRSLAQKDLKLQPQTRPIQRLARQPTHQSNDAMIRREMMRPILANAPAVLTQARRGMQGMGKQCPICSIMFYQDSAISGHMRMRHGMDYNIEEEYHEGEEQEMEEQFEEHVLSGGMQHRMGKGGMVKKGVLQETLDPEDPPPTLEKQPPGEQVVIKEPPRFMSQSLFDPSRMQPTRQLQQLQMLHEPPHMRDVQEMYERGELRDGDRIIIQEDGRQVEYTVNDDGAADMDEMEGEEEERDDEAEESDVYAEEKMRRDQQMAMSSRGGQRQQHRAASAARQSTSSAAGRKRPREDDASIWADDLLEDDEELEEMQRQVDQRNAEDAARGRPSTSRGRQMPPIMQRRG